MSYTKLCQKCKTNNPLHANYCRCCGEKFENVPQVETANFISNSSVGDTLELFWNVINADTVLLNGQAMPLVYRYKIDINDERNWELIVLKADKKVTNNIHILPNKDNNFMSHILKNTRKKSRDLKKACFTFILIDFFPLISLLILFFCSSWLRYIINLSYKDWNNFILYVNVLLFIWIAIGIVYSCIKFISYKK